MLLGGLVLWQQAAGSPAAAIFLSTATATAVDLLARWRMPAGCRSAAAAGDAIAATAPAASQRYQQQQPRGSTTTPTANGTTSATTVHDPMPSLTGRQSMDRWLSPAAAVRVCESPAVVVEDMEVWSFGEIDLQAVEARAMAAPPPIAGGDDDDGGAGGNNDVEFDWSPPSLGLPSRSAGGAGDTRSLGNISLASFDFSMPMPQAPAFVIDSLGGGDPSVASVASHADFVWDVASQPASPVGRRSPTDAWRWAAKRAGAQSPANAASMPPQPAAVAAPPLVVATLVALASIVGSWLCAAPFPVAACAISLPVWPLLLVLLVDAIVAQSCVVVLGHMRSPSP